MISELHWLCHAVFHLYWKSFEFCSNIVFILMMQTTTVLKYYYSRFSTLSLDTDLICPPGTRTVQPTSMRMTGMA